MTPPLRLHGYPVSNYFNVVRAALIEKELAHEIVVVRAAQDETFLAMNPMGKIPVLESPDGWIGETVAILEYLEDAHPQMPLRPDAPGERARTRQIINVVQMYVEAPARSLFPGVFGGGENSPATLTQTRTTLDRATTALARLTNPAPFLLGSQLTNADLFAFYNLDIADRVTRFLDHRSIVAEAGLADWHARLTERASSHVVLSDFEPYFGRYLEDKGAAYRAPAPAAGTPAHA